MQETTWILMVRQWFEKSRSPSSELTQIPICWMCLSQVDLDYEILGVLSSF